MQNLTGRYKEMYGLSGLSGLAGLGMAAQNIRGSALSGQSALHNVQNIYQGLGSDFAKKAFPDIKFKTPPKIENVNFDQVGHRVGCYGMYMEVKVSAFDCIKSHLSDWAKL